MHNSQKMFERVFLRIACKTHFVYGPNCASSSAFDLLSANCEKPSEEHFDADRTISSNETWSTVLAVFVGISPFAKSSSSLKAAITSDVIFPSDKINSSCF